MSLGAAAISYTADVFRIGAPNLPMAAISEQKRKYSQLDHRDWVRWWNAVNEQEGRPDKNIEFYWADIFPIRTPTVLRAVLVKPELIRSLCKSTVQIAWRHLLLTTSQSARVGNRTRTWQMIRSSSKSSTKPAMMAPKSLAKPTIRSTKLNFALERRKRKKLEYAACRAIDYSDGKMEKRGRSTETSCGVKI